MTGGQQREAGSGRSVPCFWSRLASGACIHQGHSGETTPVPRRFLTRLYPLPASGDGIHHQPPQARLARSAATRISLPMKLPQSIAGITAGRRRSPGRYCRGSRPLPSPLPAQTVSDRPADDPFGRNRHMDRNFRASRAFPAVWNVLPPENAPCRTRRIVDRTRRKCVPQARSNRGSRRLRAVRRTLVAKASLWCYRRLSCNLKWALRPCVLRSLARIGILRT